MHSNLEYITESWNISKYNGAGLPAYLRESRGFDKYSMIRHWACPTNHNDYFHQNSDVEYMNRDWVCPTNHNNSFVQNYFLNSYLHDDRNMKTVIQRFSNCKDCVNILYKFALQRIPKLLEIWKLELDEVQNYKTFVIYTNEIIILPLLVSIQQKHKKMVSKSKQKLKRTPDRPRRKKVSYKPKRHINKPSTPGTMQKILNHPLYTPDVWRSVIRLATFRIY